MFTDTLNTWEIAKRPPRGYYSVKRLTTHMMKVKDFRHFSHFATCQKDSTPVKVAKFREKTLKQEYQTHVLMHSFVFTGYFFVHTFTEHV